jgi:hypothetical protein
MSRSNPTHASAPSTFLLSRWRLTSPSARRAGFLDVNLSDECPVCLVAGSTALKATLGHRYRQANRESRDHDQDRVRDHVSAVMTDDASGQQRDHDRGHDARG